jgi:hypothetical protein
VRIKRELEYLHGKWILRGITIHSGFLASSRGKRLPAPEFPRRTDSSSRESLANARMGSVAHLFTQNRCPMKTQADFDKLFARLKELSNEMAECLAEINRDSNTTWGPGSLVMTDPVWSPNVYNFLENLDFSGSGITRWVRLAERAQYYSVGEYISATDDDLYNITNFGERCMKMTNALRDHFGLENVLYWSRKK